MSIAKPSLSASLRSAPLLLPGGEKSAAAIATPVLLGFLAPEQGERWSPRVLPLASARTGSEPEKGCFTPLPGGIS